MSKKQKTVDVPGRGRRWVTGAFVRDGRTLYRVSGKPVRYHEDALPLQPVSAVRKKPSDWIDIERLFAVMDDLEATGTPTPLSRNASETRPGSPIPPTSGTRRAGWGAREDATPYASFPSIEVRGDVVVFFRPIYDDSPVVTWKQDAALADEVYEIILRSPNLARYPRVRVS